MFIKIPKVELREEWKMSEKWEDLSENEQRIIGAYRSGGEVNIYAHRLQTHEEAKDFVEQFKSVGSVATDETADGNHWVSASDYDNRLEVVAFYG